MQTAENDCLCSAELLNSRFMKMSITIFIIQHFRFVTAIALFWFLSIVNVPAQQVRPANPNGVDVAKLAAHIAFLGQDSLMGRGTGSIGERIAAHYIAGELQKNGVAPLGDNQRYFQLIPMHGSRPLADTRFQIYSGDRQRSLKLGKDYLLLKSGRQAFLPNPVPLVFVGYGIIAPEYDYNDYQTVSVDNKIVVFLEGEPPSDDKSYFRGAAQTVYATAEAKQRLAISRGAVGSIMIRNRLTADTLAWERRQQDFYFEEVSLAYSVTSHLSLLMHPRAVVGLFENAPYTLPEVLQQAAANRLESFEMATRMSYRGNFERRNFIALNVVGWIPGWDVRRRNDYVVISAHYDHLGVGRPVGQDSIYNGVFDNAAGVAGVLEISRLLAANPPRRSIIFLFTTGEERGLLGARYFLDHSPVPLYRTIANINVDGLAMFDTFEDLVAVGGSYSTLGALLQKFAEKKGLTLSGLPESFPEETSFVRSDQIAFAQSGIPAVLILNGLRQHNASPEQALQRMMEWNRTVYHSPFDDLSQEINYQAAAQLSNLIAGFSAYLANIREKPQWYSGVSYGNIRLQTRAEKR